MNCHECIYVGNVPGSVHRSCKVLHTSEVSENIVRLLEIGIATGMAELNDKETGEPVVKLDPHGVKNGWAAWPVDFDPIWIQECKFYKNKNDEHSKTKQVEGIS